jgi:hypothetical protein
VEARGAHGWVAVRADFRGLPQREAGRQGQRAAAVWAAFPARLWQARTWRAGSAGPVRGKCLALRCGRVEGDGSRHLGWLSGQRPGRGQAGERQYYWSNFPAHTPLAVRVEYAPRRPWVEHWHEEAKELWGGEQYQGRLWEGFHRQAVTLRLAYSFLGWLGWHERQQPRRPGRPRGAFSPAARSPALFASGSPAQPRRLAAGGGYLGIIPHRSHYSLPATADLTK